MAAARTIDVIRRRIDAQGTGEIKIKAVLKANPEIIIEVPGQQLSKIGEIKGRLQSVGRLEFRIALPREHPSYRKLPTLKVGDSVPGHAEQRVVENIPESSRKEKDQERIIINYGGEKGLDWMTGETLVSASPELRTSGILGASESPWIVSIRLDNEGKYQMARLSTKYVGKPMAIILDGKCYCAPIIKSVLDGGEFYIENFPGGNDEAKRISNVLNSGALPAELELRHENFISPDIGVSARNRGLIATVLAFLVSVVFFVAYYRAVGLVANLALLLNLVLTIGFLSSIGAVLTLPGIAGLILTLGMALDANVLIFERIREEKAKGRSIALCLKNGYERAWSAIFDSNITTIFTALIFWYIGTGPVQGFGITLTIGITFSMFTAVFVTRVIFEALHDAGRLEQFKMSSLIPATNLNFVRWMKLACVASAVVILAGWFNFRRLGDEKYDLDFRAGYAVQFVTNKPIEIDEVRQRLEKESGLQGAKVQAISRYGANAKVRETLSATAAREFKIAIGDPALSDPGRIRMFLQEKYLRTIFPLADAAGSKAVMPGAFPKALEEARIAGGAWLGFSFSSEIDRDAFVRIFRDAGGDGSRIWPRADLPGESRPAGALPAKSRTWGGFLGLEGHRLALESFLRSTIRDRTPEIASEGVPSDPEWKTLPKAGGGTEKVLRAEVMFDRWVEPPMNPAEVDKRLRAWSAENPKTKAIGPESPLEKAEILLSEDAVQKILRRAERENFPLDPMASASRKVRELFREIFGASLSNPFPRVEFVSKEVSEEMSNQALLAMGASLIIMVFYLWFRFFEFRYGFAAMVALLHDALVAFGITAAANALGLIDGKVNLTHVAALLTIIGFSVNDTIVIFDRIRENLQALRRDPTLPFPREAFTKIVNDALNQTLARTILTTSTVLLTVLVLFFVGRGEGSVLEGFAFTLFVGCVAGTYSTVYIAVPLLVAMHRGGKKK